MSGRKLSPESLFARYLDARDRDGTDILEALCAKHPEPAAELRQIHVLWQAAQRSSPGTEGETVLPFDELADPAAWSAFLNRLRLRGADSKRYQKQDCVGEGAMGRIDLVYDVDLRRALAQKVMKERPREDRPAASSRLGRFLEEAQVTAQLDHPGIVPVHELGIDGTGEVYFTMKLVKGEDLLSVLNRVHDPVDEEWNETRALSTLHRVCEAMAYAHAKGVIHRDLKPANIMVGRYGETYVMDWGLARVTGLADKKDLRLRPGPAVVSADVRSDRKDQVEETPDSPLITMDGDVVGTPLYMPPEQAAGRLEEIGPHSDVYAVGAMLYQLLTDRMPYVNPGDRVSNHMILAMVRAGPPKPLHTLRKDVPAELQAICERAMAREIGGRYPDMTALAHDLRAYLENRVVEAYESGPIAELRKWVARNKGITATAMAAAVLIAALTAWFVLGVKAKEREARASEQNALRHKRQAAERKSEFDQLAGVVLLEEALVAEKGLLPAWPELIPEMDHWLKNEATKLVALRGVLSETLSKLEARARLRVDKRQADGPVNPSAPDVDASDDPRWRFEDDSQRFLHDTLSSLSQGILDFEAGAKVAVEERLSWARRIEELTTHHPNALMSWEEAREAILSADGVLASELYRDQAIDLKPQLGLVPIGMNPVTYLWEFYHLRSAWDPESGVDPADLPIPEHEEDGSIVMRDGLGIVFALIPGGTFLMGAQKEDPAQQNYDPQVLSRETPVHEVALDPYLLARHELTKGQWYRLSRGEDPGWHQRGPPYRTDPVGIGWTHPVEQVPWEECVQLLQRYGLALPTEAQWERGARGGTSTPWWTGPDASTLEGVANVLDLKGEADVPVWGRQEGDFTDGFTTVSPVGWFRANPFGLYDVHGNVWEWCRDAFGRYSIGLRQGDGLRGNPGGPTQDRIARGGSFRYPALGARSANRYWDSPGIRDGNLGARAARAVR